MDRLDHLARVRYLGPTKVVEAFECLIEPFEGDAPKPLAGRFAVDESEGHRSTLPFRRGRRRSEWEDAPCAGC